MQTESMEWSCKYCGGGGKVDYPTNRIEKSTRITCSHCLKPSAYVWCSTCGIGGQITKTSFLDSPSKWQCLECKIEHQLPKNFHQTEIIFSPNYFEDKEDLYQTSKLKNLLNFRIWKANFLSIILMAILLVIVFFISMYVEQIIKSIFSSDFISSVLSRFFTLSLMLVVFYAIHKLSKPEKDS